MAIYRKKKFTSPKKWAGRGPPGPIGSAANVSVPAIDCCSSVRRVCCCGPGGQEISMTAARPQQRRRSSTAVSSKCEQCHVYSRRRRLNAIIL